MLYTIRLLNGTTLKKKSIKLFYLTAVHCCYSNLTYKHTYSLMDTIMLNNGKSLNAKIWQLSILNTRILCNSLNGKFPTTLILHIKCVHQRITAFNFHNQLYLFCNIQLSTIIVWIPFISTINFNAYLTYAHTHPQPMCLYVWLLFAIQHKTIAVLSH